MPKIQINSGSPSYFLLNSNAQSLENSEHEVVGYQLVFSSEQRPFNPLHETASIGEGELPPRTFSSLQPVSSQDSIMGFSEPSINADGFIGDRLRELWREPANTQNSITVLEVLPKLPQVSLAAQSSKNETFTITATEITSSLLGQTTRTFPSSDWQKRQELISDTNLDEDHLNNLEMLTLAELELGPDHTRELKTPYKWMITDGQYINDHRIFKDFRISAGQKDTDVDERETQTIDRTLLLDETEERKSLPEKTINIESEDSGERRIVVREWERRFDTFADISTADMDEGTSKSFVLSLATTDKPTGKMTITIAEDENLKSDRKSFTFNAIHYIVYKFTLTHVDDNSIEDGVQIDLLLTAEGGGYDGVTKLLCIKIKNDDDPELAITPTTVHVKENTESTFEVSLLNAPLTPVTVSIEDFSTYYLTFDRSPSSLTFTPDNYGTPQPVTVSAKENRYNWAISEEIDVTAKGGGYDDQKEEVRILLQEIGLKAPARVELDEGEDTEFEVSLTAVPTADVTVRLIRPRNSSYIPNRDVSYSTLELIFTPDNYLDPQPVQVWAVDDPDFADDFDLIGLEASGGDYGGVSQPITVKVNDTDVVAEVMVDPTTVPIKEGGQGTFSVWLSKEPTSTVTVDIPEFNNNDLTRDESTLTFTASDYAKHQTVTVDVTHDKDADDDRETITLEASGGEYDDLTENVTIKVDDDEVAGAAIVVNPETVNVDENKSEKFQVSLAVLPEGDVTVMIPEFKNSDLTRTPDQLTFTEQNHKDPQFVTVTAGDDQFADPTEIEFITLEAKDGGYDGVTETVEVRLRDDDVLGAGLEVNPEEITVDEGGQSKSFTVRLMAKPAADVTVSIETVTGSRLSKPANSTLTFTPAGTKAWNITQTIQVQAKDDSFVNKLDTEFLKLEALGGGYNNVSKSIPVTINDNELTSLIVDPVSVTLTRGAPKDVKVKLSLSSLPFGDVKVKISGHDGTYLALDKAELTIPKLSWKGTEHVLGFEARDDNNLSDDTVTLTLTTSGGGYDKETAEIEVKIKDRVIPEARFASSLSNPKEDADIHNVKISVSPAPSAALTLDYTLGGKATEGTDYSITNSGTVSVSAGATSANIPVKIIDDEVVESTETVVLTLTGGGTGYNVGSPSTHTLTIQDNDPPASVTVTLLASPTSIGEGESVKVTATLSPPLSDEVTIDLQYEPGDPPTEPGDYDPLGQITIPGGSPNGSGTIYIQDDDISEGEERFTVAINGSRLRSGIELGSPSSVEITILDDDPPPPVEVSLSAAPNPVDEGESITVTATLTGVLEEDVAVPLVYNYDETNQPPENGDYIPLSNITIFRGETEGSGEIQTIRDTDAEDEIFIVALGDLPPDLLQLGKETSQTVTIRDITSSEVIVNLSADPDFVEEGKSVTVTATLSEAQDTDVTIPLTVADGTAGTQDYQASPPVQIEINAGETRGNYSISTVADKIAEDDETFTVGLGLLPSGLAKGEQSLVKVTIIDDDEAGINTPPSVSVVEGGTQTFQITLTSKPLSEVTVMMTLPTGSLLTYSPPHLTFSPADWDMAKSVTLTAGEDDTDFSPNFETLTVTANGGGYVGESEKISVTITDNDAPGIDVRDRVTVPEGGSEELKIALARSPSGPVVVTITRNTNPDLMLDRFSLTFTTADWQTPKTVTLTATEDDDFETDSGILLLTASGGGYDELIPITITVTIAENDAAGLVVEEAVTMEEGGTHPLEVRFLAQPSGPVTVTFSGHAGTDLSLRDTPLTFTTSNWNQAQTVTLTAAEDEDYETDTIELNLAASGGGYNGEDAPVTVTITDNDERPGPLTITIYDKRELEDAGAIQLPIELSRPTDAVVTVQYASTDGTAESGLDYTASRGIVIFDPGATRGVIEIEITDDEIPESTETFAVTLLKPQNAIIARGTGTGTILDNDGGTAILRVEDALVQEEEGMVRFQVSLSHPQRQMISAAYRTQDGTAKAGEDYEASSGVVTLAPGTVDAMIAVPLLKDGLDWQEETFTVHLESSENAEIAKAVGVATIQAATTVSQEALEAYTARFVRTSATQVVEALGDRFRGADGTACGAATRAEMSRLWYSASSWDPSLGELLGGCRMSATSYSGSFSVWGRGAFRQFNGREDDGLTLDGEVTTGMLGADYRWKGGWLAGVLLSHSQGEGSFAAAQELGEITAGLTGVYPYVSVARAGWEVWLSAGAGRGQADVLELDGDLTSRFGAMGVRGTLVSNSTIGLNYHGDVLVTDAEIEAHAVTAEVYRVRAGVEANARINNVLRPYVEANVRSDGGSAETGVGLEFGGGMRIAYPAWRLKADVHAQGLVMHTAEGFSEWGISGFVQVGNRSEGLMMRVRPSWGLGQGMSLYGQQTIRDAAPMGTGVHRTELELGYGVPWKEGTARSIMGVTQLSQGRMYRLGGELHPWENLTFSIFGLAHGRTASLGDIGVNVRGSLRY